MNMIKLLFKNLFWGTALIAVLVATPYVYYFKIASMRASVDKKIPQFKAFNEKIVALSNQRLFPVATDRQSPSVAAATPATAATPAPVAQEPAVETPVAMAVAQVESQPTRPQTLDLAELSRSRAKWPKTILLKKSMEFPAVFNGKVIGKVKTPPGTEARVIAVKADGIQVDYRGGDLIVQVADTDLLQRVMAGLNLRN